MALLDLFSKRQRRLRGDVPDVYTYDQIPQPLRVQIVQIASETIGSPDHYGPQGPQSAYDAIVKTLRKEYGVFRLPPMKEWQNENNPEEIFNFLLHTDAAESVLDATELLFRIIDNSTRSYSFSHNRDADAAASEAIKELNGRLREAGVGYQYADGEIIRIDSELIHNEAVKPALRLLNTRHYAGAHEEFLSAYDHYRHGKTKEALNDCLKAFESTMKAICDKRRWSYDPKDTASKLIGIMFEKELVPSFWQTQFTSLKSLLESSIPTGRNKLSGHGQGSTPTEVPDYIAGFMLHMTASTLVFLTTAEEKMS